MTAITTEHPMPFTPPKRRGRPRSLRDDNYGSAVALAGRKPGTEPELLLAVAVIEDAIRDVRGWWHRKLPLGQQSAECRTALNFLLYGVDLPGVDPLIWHTLANMEVLTEMTAEELVNRILANRRWARLGGEDE